WPTKGDHDVKEASPYGAGLPHIVRVGTQEVVDKLRDGEHEHGADGEAVFKVTLGCASDAMTKMQGRTAATADELKQALARLLPARWATVDDEPWIADYQTLFAKASKRRDPFPHMADMSGAKSTVNGKQV